MQLLHGLSIERKLVIITMLTSSIVLVLGWTLLLTYERYTSRERFVHELSATAAVTAYNSAAAVTFADREAVELTLQSLAHRPQIVYACVYDSEGALFADYLREGASFGCEPVSNGGDGHLFADNHLDVFRGIFAEGERVGTLHIVCDLTQISDLLMRYLGVAGGLLLVCSIVALGIASRLQTIISRPILELASVAAQVATEKDYSLRAVKQADDETGRLIDGFNHMLAEIQARDTALLAARDSLELRVEERTRELASENAERRRAEESLLQSEQLYRQMAMNGSDLMYVWHVATGQVDLYGQADGILGYAEGECPRTIDGWQRLLHPEDRQEVMAALQHSIATGEPLNTEHRIRRQDETWLYLTHRGRPVRDANDTAVKVVGACSDITARKRFEAELAYERDLLRSLMDGSADQIYFKDAQSRYIRCSRTLLDRFGIGRDQDVVGRTDFDFYSERHARASHELEQDVVRTGAPVIAIAERQEWMDGAVTWALTTKMPFRDKNNQIIGTFGISKDITTIKETEAQLAEAHRQLLETSRLAGMAEVATGVLHNVGNALNSVNVSTNVIVDRLRRSRVAQLPNVAALFRQHETDLGAFLAADPKGRQLPAYVCGLAAHLTQERDTLLTELDVLRKSIEHMKEIVTMQQGYAKVSGVAETIPVEDLVEDALHMNSAALARHDVQVVRKYAADLPRITVERHKVVQILVNLISNAKHACTQSDSQVKQLTLRVASDDDQVRFAISDNGIGIAPGHLTRIFSHGFTTRKDGHGFGLHSGALAARELGGALHVESAGPGSGATFTLELPLKPAKSAAFTPVFSALPTAP